MNSGRRSAWGLAASLTMMASLTAMAIGGALPARAQDASVAAPGGTAATPSPVLPATTPITDLLTRMDALEAQVARLTAQNEEMAHRQHQLEAKLATADASAGASASAATAPAAPSPAAPSPAAPAPAVAASPASPVATTSATSTNLSAMTAGATDRAGSDRTARPSAQRVAAVKAVIKPQTGDAALDEYSYGFRLYTAKFYPEAVQQLKLYIDKYPQDAHISHARNLLGRAYLDDGQPRDAAPWFLTNYKTDPHGARAADSLLNLAEAMRQLGDNNRSCIALNEFATNYAAEAQGRLRPDYTRTRGGLTCN